MFFNTKNKTLGEYIKEVHYKNKTLVNRLVYEGSDLSLEAADKINSLRQRGHFWEKSTQSVNRKFMNVLKKLVLIEELNGRHNQDYIRVWAWDDAPQELKDLSKRGGDEDWIALLPPKYACEFIAWLQEGGSFGCCHVDTYKHPRFPDYEVRIGSHS